MQVVESTPAPVEEDTGAISSKVVFKILPMPNVKGNSPPIPHKYLESLYTYIFD